MKRLQTNGFWVWKFVEYMARLEISPSIKRSQKKLCLKPVELTATWQHHLLLQLLNLRTGAGERSPITCKGRKGVAAFYARHFSVSPAFDGGTYLLPVAALLTPPSKEGSYNLRASMTVGCHGDRNRLARLRVRRLDHYGPTGAPIFTPVGATTRFLQRWRSKAVLVFHLSSNTGFLPLDEAIAQERCLSSYPGRMGGGNAFGAS